MKKLFVLISAALLLIGLSACQQEIQSSEVSGETVTATFDVSIPSALKTKAYGDASGLTKVNYEIWDSEFTGLVSKGEVELDENLSGTLSLKLIRFKSYSVLFWAQGAAAKHEWTDLRTINIDYTPNIENDAFAGRVLNIDATNDQNLEGSVILERPFAQINFATNDLGAGKGVNVGDLTLKSATVTVPGLATTYDGTTGKSSATAEAIEFKSTAVMAEPFVMNQVEYDHLLVFYPLMADGASENVVATTASGQDVTVSWTGKGAMNNVPVKANNRTNFYGSIFTAFGDLDVSVDDDFTTVVDPSLNFESKTISDLLASTTGNGTYLIEGTITAVAPNAADENKEDVTFMDASGAELTVALLKEDADLIVKSLGTYYQVGDAIKVIVEKNGENVSASEVIAHKRDVADIYLDIKDAEGTEPVTVTLAASEVLNHGPIVVAEGQNVILDLTNNAVLSNGRNFWDKELKYWSLISVQGGTLTIKGEGALQAAADDCYAVDVRNGGKLVIEGGKFVGNISAVYVHEGTVEIKGGEFSIQQKSSYNDSRFLLNCLDENYTAGKAKISVTGGTFAGFNPQDNLAEGESTDFVAEGYAATPDKTADTYTVDVAPAPVAPEVSESLPFTSATMGDFTINDVELGGLTYVWKEDTSNKYMKANAYLNGTDYTTESWLESPWFDLTSASAAYVSFTHCANYFSGAKPEEMVGIYVKEFGGEWVSLTLKEGEWPTGTNWTEYDVEVDLSSYAGKYIQIGVKYTSDAAVEAGTYEIMNFRIATTEKPYLNVSDTNINVEATETSASFEVTSNYDWTATSDNEGFVVSTSGNTVTVTFAANSTSEAKSATITITGAEGLKTTVKINQTGVITDDMPTYTLVDRVADLTSGTYYMGGFMEKDSSGADISAYPYHLWTGSVSGDATKNSDLLTVNYSYVSDVLTINPNLSEQDAAKGTAAEITLQAVDGKTNTWYIKVGDKYLQNAVSNTNRRLVLTDTATEWVASDHKTGGIQFLSNETYIGTASAKYDFIRSYKEASAGSVKYGLVFFKEN